MPQFADTASGDNMTVEELRRILSHLQPDQEILIDLGGFPCPVQAVFLRHGGVELSAGPVPEDAADVTTTEGP